MRLTPNIDGNADLNVTGSINITGTVTGTHSGDGNQITNINAVNVILPVEYQLIKLANGTSCIAGPKVNFSNFDLSNSSLSGINLLQVNFSNTIMKNMN